jgi:hypothetical protein
MHLNSCPEISYLIQRRLHHGKGVHLSHLQIDVGAGSLSLFFRVQCAQCGLGNSLTRNVHAMCIFIYTSVYFYNKVNEHQGLHICYCHAANAMNFVTRALFIVPA